MTSNIIVQKLRNYCNILRDDGLRTASSISRFCFF
jgi:hypothetical protein